MQGRAAATSSGPHRRPADRGRRRKEIKMSRRLDRFLRGSNCLNRKGSPPRGLRPRAQLLSSKFDGGPGARASPSCQPRASTVQREKGRRGAPDAHHASFRRDRRAAIARGGLDHALSKRKAARIRERVAPCLADKEAQGAARRGHRLAWRAESRTCAAYFASCGRRWRQPLAGPPRFDKSVVRFWTVRRRGCGARGAR